VGFTDIVQQADDEVLDGLTGGMDTRNDLAMSSSIRSQVATYLRDDLKPNVHVDGGQALRDGLRDTVLVSVRKPQRQQPQGILQRVAGRKRDTS